MRDDAFVQNITQAKQTGVRDSHWQDTGDTLRQNFNFEISQKHWSISCVVGTLLRARVLCRCGADRQIYRDILSGDAERKAFCAGENKIRPQQILGLTQHTYTQTTARQRRLLQFTFTRLLAPPRLRE